MAATCELTQILVPPGASFAAASAYGYPVIATSSLLEVLPNTDSSRITLHWIGAPDYTHLETTTDLEDPNSWVPAEISQATIVDGFDITVDFLTEGPVRYFRLSTSGP